ncbi:hypothetical protein TNCV_2623181 [Trichonephila clavipes]|nr:hypothetical protein TNCV_2623181 [Trichonephila clavipes]
MLLLPHYESVADEDWVIYGSARFRMSHVEENHCDQRNSGTILKRLVLHFNVSKVWNCSGGKFSPVPCTRDSAHKTFGPTDLKNTYSVCTRRVFGGTDIEPRPSGLESGAQTTRLPTAC